MSRTLEIGIVTDEVSRDLARALAAARSWGIDRFELREGGERRFPHLTSAEIAEVDDLVRSGGRVTAVSPGILKGSVADRETVRREIDEVLPRSLELARRFECPTVIVFGFERYAKDGSDGSLVQQAFAEVAELAAGAGMTAAVENEPDFWIDRPASSAQLLDEIDHPALRLNWDPANLHWGGTVPDHQAFAALKRHLANVHVKDFYPDDPSMPWRPVGTGATPWENLLEWIVHETDLEHVTVETHCTPLEESSRQSVESVRALIDQLTSRPASPGVE